MKKWCWILAAVLLVRIPAPAEEKNSNQKKSKTIPFSMLIPGVEQIKSKKYVKGALLLGTFLGSTLGAFHHNKKGSDWYDKYQNSTNVDDVILFRQRTEDHLKKRNLFIAGIFSVWLVHIIDLKFFKSGKAGVKGTVSKNEINIGFYYLF